MGSPPERRRCLTPVMLVLTLMAGIPPANSAPNATPQPAGQTATITLQDGVDGFSGASDTGPNGVLKLTDDHKSTDPRWPNPGYRRSIRFDGLKTAIPGNNVHVISAELSLRYFDEWWSVNIYHIAAQRSLDGSLDNLAANPDDTILLYGDRFPGNLKTPRPSWVTWKLRPKTVQAWLDDPANNHGLVLRVALRDYSRGDQGNYGVSFRSCSFGNPSERPQLKITYSYTGSLPPRAPVWDFNYAGAEVGTRHIIHWTLPAAGANETCQLQFQAPAGPWKALADRAPGAGYVWQTSRLAPADGYRLRIRACSAQGAVSAWVESPPFQIVRRDVAYQVGICSSMEKIRRDLPYAGPSGSTASLELAGNEAGSFQIVVANVDRDIHGLVARSSDLRGPGGVIHAADVSVRQVGYVNTVASDKYPQPYVGLWPDPLLELPRVDVPAGKVQPLWVTVHVPPGTSPGIYRGSVALTAADAPPYRIVMQVTVWDFSLPAKRLFKAMVVDGSMATPVLDRLLANHFSPAYVMRAWDWDKPHSPVKLENGQWDFSQADRIGEYCIKRGMNTFTIARFARPGQWGFPATYSADYRQRFGAFLKAYADHLRQKGWLKMGHVYNIDEAPKKDWDTCKANAQAVKAVAPDVRVMQCLNEPAGVRALAGFTDIWDVYIGQFVNSAVPQRMQAGDAAIFALCCYPSSHPNLFIDYPAMDARIIGWMSWKEGISGFEYWNATSWGDNLKRLGTHPYLNAVETGWHAATFGSYNGDGYLVYPGPGGTALSSIRLANLRDGFQDYEMLAMLKARVDAAIKRGENVSGPQKALAVDDAVCSKDLQYTSRPEVLLAARRQVADWIVGLKPAPGE